MDECLIVHSRAISKVYIFYAFVFAINIISFIIGTVNYCLSRYNLKYLEENNPDIDLTGIKSFSFTHSPNKRNIEYYYGIPNLGNTGKVYLICYEGVCKYYAYYDCQRTVCEENEDGEEVCWEETYECKKTKSFDDKSASRECRTDKSCSIIGCGSSINYDYHTYYYSSCNCNTNKNSKSIGGYKSCNADNLIYNFEYYYYNKENATNNLNKYSYLKSAVTKNESCSKGKKFCGYLDDLGNKLCYDESDQCPINIITSDESNYTYEEYFNKRIYYTTEPDEENDNHRVLGGFFVDTDLMINYNVDNGDCQTITTGKIKTLLESHYNKLYRNGLSFDPYKEINDIDKRGKSYLKWCIPGHGKEKNITIIKEIIEVYEYNKTINKDSIKPIKNRYVASYFTSLPGHLGLIASWVFILLLFNYKNNTSPSIGLDSQKSIFFYLGLIISIILIFIGAMLSITYNSEISKSNKMDIGQSIFSSLIRLNITYLTFVIILIFAIILFFVYLSITPKTIFEVSLPEKSYNLIEQENYNKNDNSNSNNNYTNDQPNYNNAGYNNNYNYNYNNADYTGYNYNNTNNPYFNNNTNTNTYNNNDTNKGFTSGGGMY